MRAEPINECPVPTGILIIIGGKENKGEAPEKEVQKENSEPLEVLETFVSFLKKEDPKIAIITTASSEPKEIFEEYRKAFDKLGYKNLDHIHHDGREEAIKDDPSERIKAADAAFITGGDQLKLTTTYGGTNLLLSLKDKYISGGMVIGGTQRGRHGHVDSNDLCGKPGCSADQWRH